MISGRYKSAYGLSILSLSFIFFLLIVSSCGGSANTPTAGGGNACYSTACASQSDLRINVGHASQMQVHDSQEVKVTLNSISNTLISNDSLPNASIPAENATVTTTHIIPVGTPTASLADAFGPGYQVYASATLTTMTGTFKIQPLFDPKKLQALDRVLVEWRWLITPMETGNQILDIDIEVIWLPLSQSSHLSQEGPTSLGDQQINIDVNLIASITPTPTATLVPTPTPTLAPTPTPNSDSNNNNNNLQPASIVAILVALIGAGGYIGAALINNQKKKNKTKS